MQRDFRTAQLLPKQMATNREFIGVNRDFVNLFE